MSTKNVKDGEEGRDDQSLPVSLSMAERDDRYLTVKPLVDNFTIQSLSDIFRFVPLSVVAVNIGKHRERFKYLVDYPEKFLVEELLMIARLCNLTFDEIMMLVKKTIENRKKVPRKPKNKTPKN